MFGNSNTVIRDTIAFLKDVDNWNANGDHQRGKECIVTALFKISVFDSDPIRESRGAAKAIRRAIKARYGFSRGARWDHRKKKDVVDIISFNDHPQTTHADVMSVLYQAEKYTRPWWRGRMAV